ncbi:MAG: hypothetical protein WKG07_21695 [Hymenobacter sp.]
MMFITKRRLPLGCWPGRAYPIILGGRVRPADATLPHHGTYVLQCDDVRDATTYQWTTSAGTISGNGNSRVTLDLSRSAGHHYHRAGCRADRKRERALQSAETRYCPPDILLLTDYRYSFRHQH